MLFLYLYKTFLQVLLKLVWCNLSIVYVLSRQYTKFLYAPSLNYLAVVSVFVHVTMVFGAFDVAFQARKFPVKKAFLFFTTDM